MLERLSNGAIQRLRAWALVDELASVLALERLEHSGGRALEPIAQALERSVT